MSRWVLASLLALAGIALMLLLFERESPVESAVNGAVEPPKLPTGVVPRGPMGSPVERSSAVEHFAVEPTDPLMDDPAEAVKSSGVESPSLLVSRKEQILSAKKEYEESGLPFYAIRLVKYAIAAQADCAGLGQDLHGAGGPLIYQGQFGFTLGEGDEARGYVLTEEEYPIWSQLWTAVETPEDFDPDLEAAIERLVTDSLLLLGAAGAGAEGDDPGSH